MVSITVNIFKVMWSIFKDNPVSLLWQWLYNPCAFPVYSNVYQEWNFILTMQTLGSERQVVISKKLNTGKPNQIRNHLSCIIIREVLWSRDAEIKMRKKRIWLLIWTRKLESPLIWCIPKQERRKNKLTSENSIPKQR